mmetsp:Transcript_15986/g.20413  ORF Transcript_15986/g.20413 Transcript_15986/m.20413 type:complete len:231 (-) Transcript_15986:14-706(-)
MASEVSSMCWVPMESNPTMMNEFGEKIGLDVSRFAFQDCWGLDEELLGFVNQPCLAVILLFPFPLTEEDDTTTNTNPEPENVIWIPQLIGNACGTMAVMHALCNTVDNVTTSDSCLLQQFVDKISKLNSKERGEYLTTVNSIQEAHSDVIDSGSTKAPEAGEQVNHHFACFVLKNGKVYELDGRKAGAIPHKDSSPERFIYDVASIIKSDFISHSPDANGFSMITLSKAE